MTKKCTKCGEEKDIEEFGPKKASPDGRHTRCRKCLATEKREYLHRPKKEKKVIPEGFHKCSKCDEVKPLNDFRKNSKCNDGHTHVCNDCRLTYNNNWVITHKEQYLKGRKEWYWRNVDVERMRSRKYAKKNYAKLHAKYNEWVANNKDYHNEWQREYFRNLASTDPHYRLIKRCRGRIYDALKFGSKTTKTLELLGISAEQFKVHIEQQFSDGMTWEAFMNGEIEIDHICPVASFNFDDPIAQYVCFNYRNHQPLWCVDNRIKSAKWSSGSRVLWSNTIGKEIKEDLISRGIIDSSYEGC